MWQELGGLHTFDEIAQQPALWRQLTAIVDAVRGPLDAFLGERLDDSRQRVILTGAGSSAFIGEIIAAELDSTVAADVRAIATTTLLTHPALYLDPQVPTVLVSFARSGDSPESVAAVELVRAAVDDARFVHITCNAAGSLATRTAPDTFTVLMPAASCDRGFAMTSSFTCMLLAALALLGRAGPHGSTQRLEQLAALGEQALAAWAEPAAALGAERFERVVYLGSGPLQALAKEAALKILELTGGAVMAMADSPLGFRHGPKSALNSASLVLMFRSSGALARRYEADLLDELQRDQVARRVLTVGAGANFHAEAPAWPDAWLAPLWLLLAQQFALQQSATLRLTPDNPFANGIVNRVVRGVTIHDRNA